VEFPKNKGTKTGLGIECTRCVRGRALSVNYGVSLEWYDKTLESQGGGCAICRSQVPGGQGSFHVDHDHLTGITRGLLCSNCNTGIGYFRDRVDILLASISYLIQASCSTIDILGRTVNDNAGIDTGLNFLNKIGLTKQKRKGAFDKQGGKCKICSDALVEGSRYALDHCHLTGKIRGFLCRGCNCGLGRLKDSPEIIQKAIDYLNKHNQPCSPALTVKGLQAS
jgi:hypothetical protein